MASEGGNPTVIWITYRPVAIAANTSMVKIGFFTHKMGFKAIMPKKDAKTAKRIGYTVTTTVIYELRKTDQDRNIRYWTYHEDADHYAIVLVSLNVLENLGFD